MDRRRLLMIFGGAWASAALLTWMLYSSTKAPKVEKTVAIQAAARDMPSGTRLQKGDLKTIHVPEAEAPKAAIVDATQAFDHPLLFPISANEAVTLSKIGAVGGAEGLPSSIEVGKRAISVPINDTSGVSGLIQPRSHVDVLFTRTGSANEAATTTILEDVVVLAIGRATEAAAASAATAAAAQNNGRAAQSATLLVTPEQMRRVELAKNQGRISLALRNPLDRTVAADKSAVTTQQLISGLGPAKSGEARVVALPKPPEPKVEPVKEVAKKDPPPPKKVVDVYRGDKRTQEIFP